MGSMDFRDTFQDTGPSGKALGFCSLLQTKIINFRTRVDSFYSKSFVFGGSKLCLNI